MLNSAIFYGHVSHRRFTPVVHGFRFKLFYIYADLDELPAIAALSRCWSISGMAPARFRRCDFLDPQQPCLKAAVWARVSAALGEVPQAGPVRLLANWRYFGYITNPIAIYYCFDLSERLVAILCEVTNTPWGERAHYVLPAEAADSVVDGNEIVAEFPKKLRVSPFSERDQVYRIAASLPGDNLFLQVQVSAGEQRHLEARLALKREALTGAALNRMLLRYPMQTGAIIATTYWQACKLWWKGAPPVGLKAHATASTRADSKERQP